MKTAFVFNLYEPPFKDEASFRKTVAQFFIPLLKIIKHNKRLKVSLCLPLSTLEQLDMCGYTDFIQQVGELVAAERIELVASYAYGMLPLYEAVGFVEHQAILDEYALGFYLGRRQGFEGEPAVMLKNVNGFYMGTGYINEDFVKVLDDMAYKWVLVNTINAAVSEGRVDSKGSDADERLTDVLNINSVIHDIKEIDDSHNDTIVVIDSYDLSDGTKEALLNYLGVIASPSVLNNVDYDSVSSLVRTNENKGYKDTIYNIVCLKDIRVPQNMNSYIKYTQIMSLGTKVHPVIKKILYDVQEAHKGDKNVEVGNINLWNIKNITSTITDEVTVKNMILYILSLKIMAITHVKTKQDALNYMKLWDSLENIAKDTKNAQLVTDTVKEIKNILLHE